MNKVAINLFESQPEYMDNKTIYSAKSLELAEFLFSIADNFSYREERTMSICHCGEKCFYFIIANGLCPSGKKALVWNLKGRLIAGIYSSTIKDAQTILGKNIRLQIYQNDEWQMMVSLIQIENL